MKFSEMGTGERMILIGHLLGSFAMALISIGGILKAEILPTELLYAGERSKGKSTAGEASYWES